MRSAFLAVLALGELSAHAEGREFALAAQGSASTMLIDRGEQLSDQTFEAEFLLEWAGANDAFYAGAYRLSPLGSHHEAFAEEVDYFVGYAWDAETYSADVSAAWLTYPGESPDDKSLELAGEIVLNQPLTPALAGFYDAEFEDWGLELTAGPTWEIGEWEAFVRGRAGFVTPGDGSDTRSYWGAETGAARPLNELAEFGVYARAEWADQDSFADEFSGGDISHFKQSGIAIGAWIGLAL